MPPHHRFAVSILVVYLLLGVRLSPAQTLALTQSTAPVEQTAAPAAPAQDVEGPIRPETVTKRKDAVQKRLELLEHLMLVAWAWPGLIMPSTRESIVLRHDSSQCMKACLHR